MCYITLGRYEDGLRALESLAHVRAATGDAMAALSAVDALAEKADDGKPRAELWVRAARICEEAGDVDGAIMRFKKALDAQFDNAEAAKALRGKEVGTFFVRESSTQPG